MSETTAVPEGSGDALAKLGEEAALSPGGLALDGDGFWYIAGGPVRLFASAAADGGRGEGAGGRRLFLFELQAGDALLGLGAAGAGEEAAAAVIAAGDAGTRLVHIARERLRRAADADQTVRAWLGAALERWAAAWYAALTGPSVAAALLPAAGQSLRAGPGDKLRVKGGTLWVRAEDGALRWLTRSGETALERDAYIPLAKDGLLDVSAETAVSAADTEAWLRLDPAWLGLGAFHHGVRRALSLALAEQDRSERDRLRRRSESDRRLMGEAVSGLRRVTQDDDSPADDPAAGRDPLLAACRAVCRAMDMPPAEAPPRESGAGDRLRAIADASRFRTREVKLEGRWWREDNGPLLAISIEADRPMALLPVKPGQYELYDPAAGTVVPVDSRVAGDLNVHAYQFYRPLPSRPLKLLDIVRFSAVRTLRKDAAVTLAIGIAVGLLGMVVPIASGLLLDTVIPGADRGQLAQMALVLLGTSVAVMLFELARSIAVMRIEGRVDLQVQAAVWDRLLRLPVAFFRRFSSGDLAMRANSISAIRQQLSGIAVSALFSFVFSSFNLVLLFFYDTRLALLAIGLVAVGLVVSTGFALLQIRYQRELMKQQGRLGGLMLQLLGGVAKFRVAAAERRAFHLWSDLFGRQNRISYRMNRLASWFASYQAVFPIATSMALYYAVVSLPGKGISTGQFIAFLAAFSTFLSGMMALSSSLLGVMGVVTLYERAKPILEAEPEERQGNEDPGVLDGSIEINRLHFRYGPEQSWVIRDLSLTVRPGEFVAIVGDSGSGKSTLMRLLLGFETPESGSIRYGGKDMKTLDPQALRRQMGVVLQHADVMAGDLYSNIVGSSGLSLDDAWQAARMAGLEEDIRQMPMGMHTMVPDGGGTLSGGQRQRLLIARAVVRKPKIVFFDEATSALDNRTQAVVSESLRELQATRIVIAHRLSTVRHADRIIVLSGGAIGQSGTFDELMAKEGKFLQLAGRQTLG